MKDLIDCLLQELDGSDDRVGIDTAVGVDVAEELGMSGAVLGVAGALDVEGVAVGRDEGDEVAAVVADGEVLGISPAVVEEHELVLGGRVPEVLAGVCDRGSVVEIGVVE